MAGGMRRRGERPSLRVCARLGVVPMAGSREGSFPRHADHRDGRLCRGDAPVAGSAFARGIRARGSSARRLTHSNRSASSHATTPSRAGTSRRIGLHIASLCTPTVRCLTCCCGVVAQSWGTTAGLKRPTSSPSAVGMRTGRGLEGTCGCLRAGHRRKHSPNPGRTHSHAAVRSHAHADVRTWHSC